MFSLHLDRSKNIFSIPLKVVFDELYILLMYSIPLSMFFLGSGLMEMHILHTQEPFIVN